MSTLPFDLTEIIHAELLRERREPDGLLHASSHLTGSLRHAQLDVAGAPKIASPLVQEITLKTGTMWHEWIHAVLRRLGLPYMAEVNVTPWLPNGWGGTADAVVWNPETHEFVLRDFKTSKGESIRYIQRDGAKREHVAQTSLYYHGLVKMGLPMAPKVGVYYLPKNDTRSKEDLVEPVLVEFKPIGKTALHKEAARRRSRVNEYIDSLNDGAVTTGLPEDWLTDALEPVQERQQRVYFDKNTATWEVKLVPHWSAAFCEFPDELCNCSTQGTTKIGFYDLDGTYYARPGYEEIEPKVIPPEPA